MFVLLFSIVTAGGLLLCEGGRGVGGETRCLAARRQLQSRLKLLQCVCLYSVSLIFICFQ